MITFIKLKYKIYSFVCLKINLASKRKYKSQVVFK